MLFLVFKIVSCRLLASGSFVSVFYLAMDVRKHIEETVLDADDIIFNYGQAVPVVKSSNFI